MKKRIFTVLIAAVMTFSLAACQGMTSGKEDREFRQRIRLPDNASQVLRLGGQPSHSRT